MKPASLAKELGVRPTMLRKWRRAEVEREIQGRALGADRGRRGLGLCQLGVGVLLLGEAGTVEVRLPPSERRVTET